MTSWSTTGWVALDLSMYCLITQWKFPMTCSFRPRVESLFGFWFSITKHIFRVPVCVYPSTESFMASICSDRLHVVGYYIMDDMANVMCSKETPSSMDSKEHR